MSILESIHAEGDYERSRLIPLRGKPRGFGQPEDRNVGLADERREVAREPMESVAVASLSNGPIAMGRPAMLEMPRCSSSLMIL